MEQENPSRPRVPATHRAFVLVVGTGLMVLFIYAGYSSWPPLPILLIGGAAQTAFRITKRMWRDALNRSTDEPATDDISNPRGLKYVLLVYVAMILVCAFWYGIGSAIAWATS